MTELIDKTLAGRYSLDAFLSKKVWRRYTSLEHKQIFYLAMKILHAELAKDKAPLRRFRCEARAFNQMTNADRRL
jgi:hypothetical protein